MDAMSQSVFIEPGDSVLLSEIETLVALTARARRLVVLTGAGSAFCVGADMSAGGRHWG